MTNIVDAYSVADDHPHYLVPCECGRVHMHGASEGPRQPHCQTAKHERYPNGYTLKLVGPADVALLVSVYGKGFKRIIAEHVRDYQAYKSAKASRNMAVA